MTGCAWFTWMAACSCALLPIVCTCTAILCHYIIDNGYRIVIVAVVVNNWRAWSFWAGERGFAGN